MIRAVQLILLLIFAETALGGLQRSHHHHGHNHDQKNSTIVSPSLNETLPPHIESPASEDGWKVATGRVFRKMANFVEDEVAEINRLRNDPDFMHDYMPTIIGALLGIAVFITLVCFRRHCCRTKIDMRYHVQILNDGRGGQRNRVCDASEMLLPPSRFDDDCDDYCVYSLHSI